MWRLTKKVGALLYRNSVYVLPSTRERLEDFQWLCQQIRDSKGEATVFISEAKDEAEDDVLREQFLQAREQEYRELEKRVTAFSEQHGRPGDRSPFTTPQYRVIERDLKQLEETFQDIRRVDFFDHPLGAKIDGALRRLRRFLSDSRPKKSDSSQPLAHHPRSEFRGRTWATRPHIHIDRLCSAWLIKRFIDPKARFVFEPEEILPRNAIAFDVFGAEFGHRGDHCTFETLLESFRIRDDALSSIAELVHEIDLKDRKFSRPESPGLDMVVRAISDHLGNDTKTLELGSRLLDALYERFSRKGKS